MQKELRFWYVQMSFVLMIVLVDKSNKEDVIYLESGLEILLFETLKIKLTKLRQFFCTLR